MAAVLPLQLQKKAMRKSIAAILQAIPPSVVQQQSEAVTARMLAWPVFQQCKYVSCYLSMPTAEVDTSSFALSILRSGKGLFVPKIDQRSASSSPRMDFLKIYGEDDLASLPSGVWGIKEPGYLWQGQPRLNALDMGCERLDMIMVPGVAFDRRKGRLGHGKGYYDRFIATYSEQSGSRPPLLVALSLKDQLLEEDASVPTGEHDWKMDCIICPSETIE